MLRKLAPVVSVVAVLGLWGGTYLAWGRPAPEADASTDRRGGDKEIEQKLGDLKTSVLGKSTQTRGDDVHAPQIRPPKSDYDYTSREVCLRLKLNDPEKYKNVDCSSDKFASPEGWKWEHD